MTSYQVTARKWRPQDFSQVIGQDHVTVALTNAINSGKIPHAYLFSGPRGVGKTSTARILAKLLNCAQSPHICGECTACQEITSGQSLDVREIDGASNRGIEQIREIRDNVVYTPLSLKYKIYIIDEVHMLTKEASNALLKVLEEPPAHVIFMLATTEANKVLPTIRSRCQHYLLKRVSLETLIEHLAYILEQEQVPYEKEALEAIAQAGDGSVRDSQTILDQVILYSESNLTLEATRQVLGIPSTVYFENIIQSLINKDIVSALEKAHAYLMEMGDGMSFTEHLTLFLRSLLFVKKLPENHPLLNISQERYQYLQTFSLPLEEGDIVTLLNLALELADTLRKEASEKFWIESTLFKMLDYKNRISLSELRQEILKVLGRGGDQRGNQQGSPSSQRIQSTQRSDEETARSVTDKTNPLQGIFGDKLDDYQTRMSSSALPPKRENIPIESGSVSHFPPIQEKPEGEGNLQEEAVAQGQVGTLKGSSHISDDSQKEDHDFLTPQPVPVPIEENPKNHQPKNPSSLKNKTSEEDTVGNTIKNLFEIP